MKVYQELTHEEIASLYHQRTLDVLVELWHYDCKVVLGTCALAASVQILDVGSINTSTESYEVYNAAGLLQGYYATAEQAVRKLMKGEKHGLGQGKGR